MYVCVSCVCGYLSRLVCFFKNLVLSSLLVYAVVGFGRQTGACVSLLSRSHTHIHPLVLSLSLSLSLSFSLPSNAWERRQWAGGLSQERRRGIWRCFWSSGCVVTAHTVMTAWRQAAGNLEHFVFVFSCDLGYVRAWFCSRLLIFCMCC